MPKSHVHLFDIDVLGTSYRAMNSPDLLPERFDIDHAARIIWFQETPILEAPALIARAVSVACQQRFVMERPILASTET